MLFLILLTSLPQIFADIYEFKEYTHVARTFDGIPCLTGCDAEFTCVINWKWEKRNCRIFEVAPVYLTARMKDPTRKYCLSNCGYFGESYEWCITTHDLRWDYCSAYESPSSATTEIMARTRLGDKCANKCRFDKDYGYHWCHFFKDGTRQWEYCAPPTQPRVPVLRDSYSVGDKNKGNCDGFLKYVLEFPSAKSTGTNEATDGFVTELAEAIQATATGSPIQMFQLRDSSPIQSYALVEMGNLQVPVVIRARITNATVHMQNEPKIPENVERKIREQMAGTTYSYEAVPLIDTSLGGPTASHNVVPRSVNWKLEEWWDMVCSVADWCCRTDGSVDMTVVVFYKDANTPVPRAFGVSLVYRNKDNSVFVDCREKIHFINF